jgi:hypothetical protein
MQNLLAFVKTRHTDGDFAQFVKLTGAETSFVIAIEILGWLKRQKRLRHELDLELNPEHTWCKHLATLLAADSSISRLFEIVDNRLRFRSSIPLQERAGIRDWIDLEYQPVLRT